MRCRRHSRPYCVADDCRREERARPREGTYTPGVDVDYVTTYDAVSEVDHGTFDGSCDEPTYTDTGGPGEVC